MQPLQRDDLWSLEEYATEREAFSQKVREHKKNRYVFVGDHMTFTFEDRLTIKYQVQEMLRVEKIFEPDDIEDELSAYNPLIPDGKNLKATLMIEYEDVEERRKALARLARVEDTIYLQVEGHEEVVPYANEDLERSTDDKTSAVHFMRFELTDEMIESLRSGASLTLGVSHPEYPHSATVPDNVRESLLDDFD